VAGGARHLARQQLGARATNYQPSFLPARDYAAARCCGARSQKLGLHGIHLTLTVHEGLGCVHIIDPPLLISPQRGEAQMVRARWHPHAYRPRRQRARIGQGQEHHT
jgi:hypothetical protein